MKDLIVERLLRNYVLFIENVLFGFFFDLCMCIWLDLCMLMMMMCGFLVLGVFVLGVGGVVGEVWNFVILMCVMYVLSIDVDRWRVSNGYMVSLVLI